MELTYRIDCRELTSRAAAHDCFARVFSLPASYGRNLDALYDVLTDLPPCTLIFIRSKEAAWDRMVSPSISCRLKTKISKFKKMPKLFEHFLALSIL